jgi:hypothetical protein
MLGTHKDCRVNEMYDDPLMAHYDMKILMDFSTQLSHFQHICISQ